MQTDGRPFYYALFTKKAETESSEHTSNPRSGLEPTIPCFSGLLKTRRHVDWLRVKMLRLYDRAIMSI